MTSRRLRGYVDSFKHGAESKTHVSLSLSHSSRSVRTLDIRRNV